MLAFIPSPHSNGFQLGPLFIRFYPLTLVAAFVVTVLITRRRWRAQNGDPRLVEELALYSVPGAVVGGRLYHDLTSWNHVPHTWWGWAAIWKGGTGIWGVIGGGALVVVVVLRRRGVGIPRFLDAAAPGLLVGHAIGRLGNYFNQELFGKPTALPWGLRIDVSHRSALYAHSATFHPTFLYEMVWDLALAAGLAWLSRRHPPRPPGLFALYVAGYCAFRIFIETLRVDPSHHVLGLRLNLYVAAVVMLVALAWFMRTQRGSRRAVT